MFTRADQLLVEQLQDRFPLHALDFHWEGFSPHLLCSDVSSHHVSEFDLTSVRFSASRKRTCIGRFDDEGKHIPCPNNNPVSTFSQCPQCAEESWIPHQECIFEPQCEGDKCDLEFCRREHVLYLAFYDTRPKIGMSSSRRIETRLIEQGADAYAIIGRWPNRKRAREDEKKLSEKLKVPQSHRQEDLLRSLSGKVNTSEIEKEFHGYRETLREKFHLEAEDLHWLDRYPVDLPLKAIPKLVDPWGTHKGAYVGVKGRWLIFESDGLNALNLHDLPTRYLARRLPY